VRTVGLKTLKNKLSEYVRLAAAGETVVITDRKRDDRQGRLLRRELVLFGEGDADLFCVRASRWRLVTPLGDDLNRGLA
jgi:hypothetical protein